MPSGVKFQHIMRLNSFSGAASDLAGRNGVIHVLDTFDPALVHDAIAFSKAAETGK